MAVLRIAPRQLGPTGLSDLAAAGLGHDARPVRRQLQAEVVPVVSGQVLDLVVAFAIHRDARRSHSCICERRRRERRRRCWLLYGRRGRYGRRQRRSRRDRRGHRERLHLFRGHQIHDGQGHLRAVNRLLPVIDHVAIDTGSWFSLASAVATCGEAHTCHCGDHCERCNQRHNDHQLAILRHYVPPRLICPPFASRHYLFPAEIR